MTVPLRFAQITHHHWQAVGQEGTTWEIVERGGRYGLVVAQWDRPDWWFDSLEEAMTFASKRDAAPPIPPSEWTTEIPFDD